MVSIQRRGEEMVAKKKKQPRTSAEKKKKRKKKATCANSRGGNPAQPYTASSRSNPSAIGLMHRMPSRMALPT